MEVTGKTFQDKEWKSLVKLTGEVTCQVKLSRTKQVSHLSGKTCQVKAGKSRSGKTS